MNETSAKKELPACPVETTLTLIGDKWKVLILRDLMPGTKRFGELKKSVGNVSQKVLTAQLRTMEESGLVNRKVYAEAFGIMSASDTETIVKKNSVMMLDLNGTLVERTQEDPLGILFGSEQTSV